MRLLKFNSFGHGSLPRRPYDIGESPAARGKREVKPRKELKIESCDEPRSLPVSESETQDDEKMSDATTSTPPSLASVHEQSLRIAALSLEKKKQPTRQAIQEQI